MYITAFCCIYMVVVRSCSFEHQVFYNTFTLKLTYNIITTDKNVIFLCFADFYNIKP